MSQYKVGDLLQFMDSYTEITSIENGVVSLKTCHSGHTCASSQATFESVLQSGAYTLVQFETEKDRFVFRIKEGI